MPAFQLYAVRFSAGLAASLFFASTSFAAKLLVNDEQPLTISSNPGFTYQVNGDEGSLNVVTDGFLLCANVDQPALTPVTVVPRHGDWRMPVAQDVQVVAYNGGQLFVNHKVDSSLVCHARGSQGEQASSENSGIFANSYETKAIEQFSNLINWNPTQGFDWNAPVWSLVPTDPCAAAALHTQEDVTCATVTGMRPAGAGGTTRSPTLWTATDGAHLFYVARVDARYGPDQGIDAVSGPLPGADGMQPEGTNNAQIKLEDAYDAGAAGYLSDSGTWCILNDAPATLDTNVCAQSQTSGQLSGTLGSSEFPPLAVGVPPLGIQHLTFYVAIVRTIVGAPPPVTDPAVAVSIHVERSVTAEGGDRFKGDDVAFGFLPASTGFAWMTGGN
ncbi:MAG TPA: hypothetical protein VJ696_14515 [Rhodanobacteraceae bacterium]|nr:hypothetical protein [Rhodanobacteraceae bacterium]